MNKDKNLALCVWDVYTEKERRLLLNPFDNKLHSYGSDVKTGFSRKTETSEIRFTVKLYNFNTPSDKSKTKQTPKQNKTTSNKNINTN
mmetsp:Transcript_8573/g.9759  ORF Transcript_8573/g.9759 Transcript_8573/m.9759 type:complete len:88 (+) Transcript_8573:102-365(+)